MKATVGELINIWLEEHDGKHVRDYRGVEQPVLDRDGGFELDERRWRFSHTYRALDHRTRQLTVYRVARPVDWLAT